MLGINYWAVVVAAIAAFVASAAWYIVFGKELAKVSAAFAKGMQKRQPWKMLVVIVQSLVLALVLAYFIGLIGNVDWVGALRVGVLLWIGLAAMQHEGTLWCSDFFARRVMQVDLSGTVQTVAQLADMPCGLGWTPQGRLLVVSAFARRLLRLEDDG